MTFSQRAIVVGVDGSAGSDQAVLWATNLAAHRKLGLHIVHGLRVTAPHHGVGIAETGAPFATMASGSSMTPSRSRTGPT